MYKHRKKISKDESDGSTRPSTSNTGRLSQISNSSNKSTSSSTTTETKMEIAGQKDKKSSGSTNLAPSDAVLAEVMGPKSKGTNIDIQQVDRNEKRGGESVGAKVLKDLGKESSIQADELLASNNKQIKVQPKSDNMEPNPIVSQQKKPSQQSDDDGVLATSHKGTGVLPIQMSYAATPSPTAPLPPTTPPPSARSAPSVPLPPPVPPPPPGESASTLQNKPDKVDDKEDKWVNKMIAKSVNEYAQGATGKIGSLKLDPNELLNQKRKLKKIDRHSEFNPGMS